MNTATTTKEPAFFEPAPLWRASYSPKARDYAVTRYADTAREAARLVFEECKRQGLRPPHILVSFGWAKVELAESYQGGFYLVGRWSCLLGQHPTLVRVTRAALDSYESAINSWSKWPARVLAERFPKVF